MAGEVVTGVFPVGDIKFKIGTKGRVSEEADMVIIKDMESFSPSMDNGVEEWNPMDQAGWVRRLMTSKSFAISLSGKRNYGDPGNDYVASLAWKNGRNAESKMEVEFPNGDTLNFNCVVNVSTPFGGDSTAVDALEFEVMSDGEPNYTLKPTV